MAGTLYWGLFAELSSHEQLGIKETVSFEGEMVALYDALTNSRDDISDYLRLADQTRGPVLELCCGSGRILLPLAEQGHSVVGVDVSNDMLAALRNKLAAMPTDIQRRVELVKADATDVDLERTFPLVILPYLSLALITERDKRRALIRGVVRHLAPGGVFAFDYAIYAQFNPAISSTTSYEFRLDGRLATVTVGWKMALDAESLVINSFWKVPREDDTTACYLEAYRVALIDHQEVEDMLRDSGLVITKRQKTITGAVRECYLLHCKRQTDLLSAG
jgi:SAM-dependent methyltransferase